MAIDYDPGPFGPDSKTTHTGTPLSELPDRREEVPDIEEYLLPHQRVIYVEHILDTPVDQPPHPSSTAALLKLMNAATPQDIGEHGPGNAAASLEGQENIEQVNLLGALFGRDSLHMAHALYDRHPKLMQATVVRLAELQGVSYNTKNEEEPGRIIHWAPPAGDPIAEYITETKDWEWPNYGAIDTNPMFIRGILRVAQDDADFLDDTEFVGRDEQQHTMREALHAATDWLLKRLDSNPEGLLEFQMTQDLGIWNQAWKDTPESYVHADGSYANHNAGIASIEVQALAYDTLAELSEFYFSQGDFDRAYDFNARAEQLRVRVLKDFWIEDERGGYFALGTDRDEHGNIRPLAVRTSNMGHALHLLEGDSPELKRRREALIKTLFSNEMLDANGIRTLGNNEVRFVPKSYHCGSVWGWDNDAISQELERAGYHGLAHELDVRLWQTINKLGYFAEFVPGDNAATADELTITRVVDVYDGEREHYSNSYRLEKPAQQVQAWTVMATQRIKRKHPQLFPGRSQPTEAVDPEKRAFEQEILASL